MALYTNQPSPHFPPKFKDKNKKVLCQTARRENSHKSFYKINDIINLRLVTKVKVLFNLIMKNKKHKKIQHLIKQVIYILKITKL